jgi:hypothetical protein
MNRQNIIVVTTPNKIQTWGNFKKACEANLLPYHSLKMKRFPIKYKYWTISKIPFNEL